MREVISIHIGQAGIQVSSTGQARIYVVRLRNLFHKLKLALGIRSSSNSANNAISLIRWETPAGSSTAWSMVSALHLFKEIQKPLPVSACMAVELLSLVAAPLPFRIFFKMNHEELLSEGMHLDMAASDLTKIFLRLLALPGLHSCSR